MASIAGSILVNAPVTEAFTAWTRFEGYPAFMEGVERVERVAPGLLRWTGDLGSGRESWEVRVLEELPDLLVSWDSASRRHESATATFASEDQRSVISVVVEFDPDGVASEDPKSVMSARLMRELERFKAQVEQGAGRTEAASMSNPA